MQEDFKKFKLEKEAQTLKQIHDMNKKADELIQKRLFEIEEIKRKEVLAQQQARERAQAQA